MTDTHLGLPELVPGTGRLEEPARPRRPVAEIRADLERQQARIDALCLELDAILDRVRQLTPAQAAALLERMQARGLLT